MQVREEAKPKLKGRVKMDDAYLGGARSGGKRGCGEAGKTPFIAAVETTIERRLRRIKLKNVKVFRKKEVERFAKAEIEPRSSAFSYGLSCWPAVPKANVDHFPMRTGSGRQAANWAPFKWVNTVLGNIKTAITGTYHHVSPKHAERYLASFAHHFNRRYDLESISQRLAWACTKSASSIHIRCRISAYSMSTPGLTLRATVARIRRPQSFKHRLPAANGSGGRGPATIRSRPMSMTTVMMTSMRSMRSASVIST